MLDLVETYAVALIVALLIGIVAAYWAFRRSAPPAVVEPKVETPAAVTAEHHVPIPVQPDVAPFVPGLDTAVTEAAIEAEAEAPLPAPPAAEGPPDNLQTLKGVGAKFAARLNELGIARFDQLARLGDAEAAALDEQMGAFKGRLARDRVIEQAGFLARGDTAGFEAAFGKLGSA